ncbi:MAG: alpha/beta fold hydrolase [Candidatus Kapabacteria bacterium]|nr:alpha/beta fold hydrolase [Ignavibacteriota bacterium]MCW5884642.1 alpha/beta fold hydrolase [Candidatus Kapabacteria bacterium]
MKYLSIITIILMSCQLSASEITGKWFGLLNIQGTKLGLVINIEEKEGVMVGTLDSPDQGAYGIPATKLDFSNPNLNFEISNIGVSYSGILKDGKVEGIFKQAGMEIPLSLSREEIKKEIPKRPQEPKPPFPYKAEDVKFYNEIDDITLAGTLTMPENGDNFPVVVMITGSGAQNRDEELLDHKPFLVISDYLTRNGIAVLRFDDRGYGESEGNHAVATSYDFSTDVQSAVKFLKSRKEINPKKIGLIGHSEGGVIAPIVATTIPEDIAYMVLLAGTGIRGDKLLLLQQELIYKSMSIPDEQIDAVISSNKVVFELITSSEDDKKLPDIIKNKISENVENNPELIPAGLDKDSYIEMQTRGIISPWLIAFMRLEPTDYLKHVKCPVFALNGEKDLQVPPKENLSAIENSIKSNGNNNVTVKEYPNLNHLFQNCETGSPNEYGEIEETFSPLVLKDIADWINKVTN